MNCAKRGLAPLGQIHETNLVRKPGMNTLGDVLCAVGRAIVHNHNLPGIFQVLAGECAHLRDTLLEHVRLIQYRDNNINSQICLRDRTRHPVLQLCWWGPSAPAIMP